jgi:hypothetical protein
MDRVKEVDKGVVIRSMETEGRGLLDSTAKVKEILSSFRIVCS